MVSTRVSWPALIVLPALGGYILATLNRRQRLDPKQRYLWFNRVLRYLAWAMLANTPAIGLTVAARVAPESEYLPGGVSLANVMLRLGTVASEIGFAFVAGSILFAEYHLHHQPRRPRRTSSRRLR